MLQWAASLPDVWAAHLAVSYATLQVGDLCDSAGGLGRRSLQRIHPLLQLLAFLHRLRAAMPDISV